MDRPPLSKRLGQHHLREAGLCRPLVDFLAPAGRRVIEVGPGGGVLSEALLRAGGRVLAWELDPAWAFAVKRRFAGVASRDGSFGVVAGDALTLPWERVPAPFLVAGNLPYNVATAIIDRLLDHAHRVERAAFLVQLEVAERLVAGPGSKAYGVASVLTAARAEARILGRVRPGSFVPPPKVESAFVGLVPQAAAPPAAEMARLRELVHAAFGRRRKTLRNALAARWPRDTVTEALAASGLDAGARAEQIPLEGFSALLHRLGPV
jgi:16S rRNA (adenine1518-N6/adenine1519-N6)-dimethyltransferase